MTVATVIEAYDSFLKGFYKDGAPPSKVEEGSEQAYLMAWFHKARAHGKLHSVEALRDSLAAYKYLVEYFDTNQVEDMDDEAQICREMAQLLPRRIEMAAK